MFYLEELLNIGVNNETKFTQNDVGIISPYKKQVRRVEIIIYFLPNSN